MARESLPSHGDTPWDDTLNAALNDISDRVDNADSANNTDAAELSKHEKTTTSAHGIADTSELLTNDDVSTLQKSWQKDISNQTWSYTSPVTGNSSTPTTTGYADIAAADQAKLVKNYVVAGLDVRNTVQTLSAQSGSITIDMTKGWVIDLTYTDNVTAIAFSNVPSSGSYRIRLRITCGVAGKTYVTPTNWRGSALTKTSTVNNWDEYVAEGHDGTNFDVLIEKNFTATVAATAPAVPNAPTGTAGNGQVALTWTDNGTGGSAITNHKVETFAAGTLIKTDTTGSATAAYTVTGLTNGTAYTFAVSAGNTVGYSGFSSASSAVTPAAAAPGAPTSVVATAGNGAATLTFTAPANNGATITTYTATSSPGGLTGTSTGTPAPATITVSGLTNSTAYTFTVTATNSAGTGSASAASNSVTPSAGAGIPMPASTPFVRMWTAANSDGDAKAVLNLSTTGSPSPRTTRLTQLVGNYRFFTYGGPQFQPFGNENAVGGETLAHLLLATDPTVTINNYVNGSYTTQNDKTEAAAVETGTGAVSGKPLCLTISVCNPSYGGSPPTYGDTILSNGTAGTQVGANDTTIIVKLGSPTGNDYFPSTTAGIASSTNIHNYVSWIRLGVGVATDEICKITAVVNGTAGNGIGAGNVKLTVVRGWWGTTKGAHGIADPVFVPVYIGKPGTTTSNEIGIPDPQGLITNDLAIRYCYNVEDADWAAFKAARITATWGNTPFTLGAMNGVWYDVSPASFFNQTDFAGIGSNRWNWGTNQPTITPEMSDFTLTKLKNLRTVSLVGAPFAALKAHVNNAGITSSTSATDPTNRLITGQGLAAGLAPYDTGSFEQWIAASNATSYDLATGRAWSNDVIHNFAAQAGDWPAIIWCKFTDGNPTAALLAQYKRYAYGSYMLGWNPNATKTMFGGPFGVSNDPDLFFFYKLGTPTVATPSGLTDSNITTGTSGVYKRVFSGGLVLVNSNTTDVTGFAFGGSYYDVTQNSQAAGFSYSTTMATSGTIPAQDSVVLVSPVASSVANILSANQSTFSADVTTGFVAPTNATVTRIVPAPNSLNGNAARLTAVAAGTMSISTTDIPVTAGQTYTVMSWSRNEGTVQQDRIRVQFKDSTGTTFKTLPGTFANNTSTMAAKVYTFAAPSIANGDTADAATVRVIYRVDTTTAPGEQHTVAQVGLFPGSVTSAQWVAGTT